MAQQSSLPRRENCGHASSPSTDPLRTDDVDAPQILMQSTALKTAVDRLLPHPSREQLTPRNHPVLPLRKPRNHLIPGTNR